MVFSLRNHVAFALICSCMIRSGYGAEASSHDDRKLNLFTPFFFTSRVSPGVAQRPVRTGRPLFRRTSRPTMAPIRPTIRPLRTRRPVPRRPIVNPTSGPTVSKPTIVLTSGPTTKPTVALTLAPTIQPSPVPTRLPSRHPKIGITISPTHGPTKQQTGRPTMSPTRRPTASPIWQLTMSPTRQPTRQPTMSPTRRPTSNPTRRPTMSPTRRPTSNPTRRPTMSPTRRPTNAPVPATSSFDITFHMQGDGLIPSDIVVFENAGKRWSQLIVADIPSYSLGTAPPPIVNCIVPATIDDLHICGSIAYIDGPSNVLGYAGPYYLRPNTFFPILGQMVFDSADVVGMRAAGTFSPVILHEMGHVLGIGTLWESKGVTGTAANNCPYLGQFGNQEYRSVSGCSAATLPTEQGGGSGTRCGHFSESCFKDELMTGFATGTMPISRLTVATLQDLGYVVNYNSADVFTRAQMNPSCVCIPSRDRFLREGELKIIKPIGGTNNGYRNKKRELSTDGYKIARDFGVKILKEAQKKEAESIKISSTFGGRKRPKKVEAFGSEIISVLYEDGSNGIFEVVVTKFDV